MAEDDKLDDVELAQQEEAPAAATSNASNEQEDGISTRKRKKTRILAAMAVLVAVILIIALPIALVNKNDDQNSSVESDQSEVGSSNDDTTNTTTTVSSLQAFSPDMTKGYASADELQTDIMFAGEFVLNQVVKRNMNVEGYSGVGFGRMNPNSGIMNKDGMAMPEMDAMPSVGTTTTGGGSDVAEDLTDYGTNNQEQGIEEGDVVVSDGTYLYTAYGDFVFVMNPRTGKEIINFQMPPNQNEKQTYGGGGDVYNGDPAKDFMPYMPQPSVRSLVIDEASKRLLVVVDGYSGMNIQAKVAVASNGTMPALFEYLGTQVRIYDTDALITGDTKPLVTKNIHGSFNSVRVIDGIAHLMTNAGVDIYTNLVAPFERYNMPNMTDDEYLDAVQADSPQAVQEFTDRLMDDLTAQDGTLPTLARIALFTDSSGDTAELSLPNGPVNSYVQIASFDMTSTSDNLELSLTGSFIPDYWARFYGAANSLIIAGQGSRFLKDETTSDGGRIQSSIDTTYFLSFSVDGTTVTPHSVGKVDGYLVNNFAIDVVDDMLRVAVTIRNNTWWWGGPRGDDDLIMIDPIFEVSTTSSEPSGTDMEMGMDTVTSDGGRLRALQDGNTTIIAPAPDDTGSGESLTENYVIMLQMPGNDGTTAGEMKELGRVKLGKPDETITAVRFFDNIAYAVTFEQRDPFYALDLSDPKSPSVLGEVDITGFSSYLHPINSDNTLILAIGQEADVNGTITGMALTIFDMTDPANPQISQRLVLDDESGGGSWSESLSEFRSARYAGGRLIIPMDIYGNWMTSNGANEFHGYIVFKADETGIEEECRINHGYGDMYTNMCYYCAWLPRRSMIFDGDLVTLNDHFIASTDMQLCQSNWELPITVYNTSSSMGCCGRMF